MVEEKDVENLSTSCPTARLPSSSHNKVDIMLPKSSNKASGMRRRHPLKSLKQIFAPKPVSNCFVDFLIRGHLVETWSRVLINLVDLHFFTGFVDGVSWISFLTSGREEFSTFLSEKSRKIFDILTFFKEFLTTEEDFQAISSWDTS